MKKHIILLILALTYVVWVSIGVFQRVSAQILTPVDQSPTTIGVSLTPNPTSIVTSTPTSQLQRQSIVSTPTPPLSVLISFYQQNNKNLWFKLLAGVTGFLSLYLLGIGALLLWAWRGGSRVIARSKLIELAAKPLLLVPGFGRWALFLGYKRRVLTLPEVKKATESFYFGLPVKDNYGKDILPDPNGDLLHNSLATALGPRSPVVVIGRGGTGKTTLLARWTSLALLRKLPHQVKGLIPIFVTPEYYEGNLIKAIATVLRERDYVAVDENIVRAQLGTGRFLVLFDGVSEVEGDKIIAMRDIVRTARNADYQGCRFIITSRALGDSPNDTPTEVSTFHLQLLTVSIIQDLLPNYHLGREREYRMRKQLASFRDRPIEPLLFNMMVSQSSSQQISDTRAKLYERYFRRILRVESKDDAWRGWLRILEDFAALFMLKPGERGLGLSHREIVDYLSKDNNLIEQTKKYDALSFNSPLDLLRQLKAGGLLDEGRRWRFAHDTFEEYFAASFIVSQIVQDRKWPDYLRWWNSPDQKQAFSGVMDFFQELKETIHNFPEFDLPTEVSLLTLYNLASLEKLRNYIVENWKKSLQPEMADWLKVNIGLIRDGKVRQLKFSAKDDGVHGIVAGSTGSGKSEFLMSMILGLAINYDPDVLNFILVDYKGGAAFEPLRDLPHCVDIVHYLDSASSVARMFMAIRAELDRRQRINVDTDSKHIVHFREKGLHKINDPSRKPYPHLFIIIDEYAEMISENSEIKAQLESITRLGRALGVSLILASQRPGGITDQMSRNIKFRICMRVETPEESRELLRRDDAAYLPYEIPGRGYLQVGNESVELIQIAHTGGDYLGDSQKETPNVVWLDRQGTKPKQEEEYYIAPRRYFEKIIESLIDLYQETHTNQQWRPWPKSFPPDSWKTFTLNTPLNAEYIDQYGLQNLLKIHIEYEQKNSQEYSTENIKPVVLNPLVIKWLENDQEWQGVSREGSLKMPPVGLIDNPLRANQSPLFINFQASHTAIFGASGWGKTTFLQTLLVSVSSIYSPAELNIYILEFGGRRDLIEFQYLPHVGAVITSNEEERVHLLIRNLNFFLEERERVLSDAGVVDFNTYKVNNPSHNLPEILVLIDNFGEFKESFDDLLESLVSILRRARDSGIHFVVTADKLNALPKKIYYFFTERLTLKLDDLAEYSKILERDMPRLGNIPGRGFIKLGKTPLEFQIALPFDIDYREERVGINEKVKLKQFIINMVRAWRDQPTEKRPKHIQILPNHLLLELYPNEILLRPKGTGFSSEPIKVNIPEINQKLFLLGLRERDLQPLFIYLAEPSPHFVVIGPSNSGKTTVLRTMILSMAYFYSPEEVGFILIDFQHRLVNYGGVNNLGDLPQVVQVVSREGDLEQCIRGIGIAFQQVKPQQLFVFVDNYDSFGKDIGQDVGRLFQKELGRLAHYYGDKGLHLIIAGSFSLFSISDANERQIQATSCGLALQTNDAVQRLKGKMPRILANTTLPYGRGFVVESGNTSTVQIASPYGVDESKLDKVMDDWIENIQTRFYKKLINWEIFTKIEQEENDEIVDYDKVDWDKVVEIIPIGGMSQEELIETLRELDEPIPMKAIHQVVENEEIIDEIVDYDKVDWEKVVEIIPIGGMSREELIETLRELDEPIPMKAIQAVENNEKSSFG